MRKTVLDLGSTSMKDKVKSTDDCDEDIPFQENL